MLRGRALVPVLAVLAVLGLAACTPDPLLATPTPTVLTEDEAFAQAEAAVESYLEALSNIDVADPQTFESAFHLTTGRQNAFDRKQYSEWHAKGWSQSGQFRSDLLVPASIADDHRSVVFSSCLDVSDVSIIDSAGASVVDPDRVDVQTLTITVSRSVGGSWRVEALSPREGGPSCL